MDTLWDLLGLSLRFLRRSVAVANHVFVQFKCEAENLWTQAYGSKLVESKCMQERIIFMIKGKTAVNFTDKSFCCVTLQCSKMR